MDAIAILLLPMAIVIACYALVVYFLRLRQEHKDEVPPRASSPRAVQLLAAFPCHSASVREARALGQPSPCSKLGDCCAGREAHAHWILELPRGNIARRKTRFCAPGRLPDDRVLHAQEGLYRIDKVGPPAMAGFIVAILATIFVVGVVDFVQCL